MLRSNVHIPLYSSIACSKPGFRLVCNQTPTFYSTVLTIDVWSTMMSVRLPVCHTGIRPISKRTKFPPLFDWQPEDKYVVTRDSIYAIARICRRPSVCLSVTRVDQSKAVEVRIMQFSPYVIPIPQVFVFKVSSRNSDGIPPSGGIKQGRGGENKLFSSFMRQYLDNGTRYDESYY